MVLFDRRWYNRATVERVMGFCTDEEYDGFVRSAPEFERPLRRSGIVLITYGFSISDEEQARRFQQRSRDPERRWHLSPMDLEARERLIDYSRAKDGMFEDTDTDDSPWHVVDAEVKKHARLDCITHLLGQVDSGDTMPGPGEPPPRESGEADDRPPIEDQRWVPAVDGSTPTDVETSSPGDPSRGGRADGYSPATSSMASVSARIDSTSCSPMWPIRNVSSPNCEP